MKAFAVAGMVVSYVHVITFLAIAGYAHPFMEQVGDCQRTCHEARTLMANMPYVYSFLLACWLNIACIVIYARTMTKR